MRPRSSARYARYIRSNAPDVLTGLQCAEMKTAANWLHDVAALSWRDIAAKTKLRSGAYWLRVANGNHIASPRRKATLRPGRVEWSAITMLYRLRREHGEVDRSTQAALERIERGSGEMYAGVADLIAARR